MKYNTDPDVIWIDESWYATRSPIGIHLLNPSVEQLEAVKRLCRSKGHKTLYCYKHIATK